MRVLVSIERIITHFDTETWQAWNLVRTVLYFAWMDKMLMQMLRVLDHSVIDFSGNLHVVDHRQVLHILSEPDTTRMR